MAEAMIINSLLDASPKQLQQLHMQPHHILQQVQSQQSCNSSNDSHSCSSSNISSADKSFPGYLYSCYPFVMPHTQPNLLHQHTGNENGLPTSSGSVSNLHLQFQHQQLQLLPANSGSSVNTPQQQQAMLNNNVLQSNCVPGYYSMVPVHAMMTGESYTSQSSLPTNHQFQSGMHIDPALPGPLVQYPFSYVSVPPPHPPHLLLQQQQYHQYLNQQAIQQSCSQNFLCSPAQNGATNLLNNVQPHQLLSNSPSQLLMQLPINLPHTQQVQSVASTGCDDVNKSSQKKVVILKDASVSTDFNEKICNKTLRDHPSPFYLGATEIFQSCLETDSRSKATETISLSENSSISNPGICMNFPNQQFGMNYYQTRQNFIPRQIDPLTLPGGLNSKKMFLPTQGQFQGPVFPFQNFALTSNVQSFYLPVIGGNSYLNLPTNYSQHPIKKNAIPFVNANQCVNLKNESDHIETDKKQKFYRKTRADANQKVASPIFEVNKEFTDLLNAAGSLIAQSITKENLEPADDGRSSQSSIPSKSSLMPHDEKPHKNFKLDQHRPFYKIDNSRTTKKNGRLDFYNKAPSGLPLAEFCNIPWQFNRQGMNQRLNNVEPNWTWNGFHKNHDARSTKRKQQKRQMLANKAAEEELEEISRERENLLQGILNSKQLHLNNDVPAEKTHPDHPDDKENESENKTDDLNINTKIQQCQNEAEEICSYEKENVSDDLKLSSVDIEAKCCDDFMETGTNQLEFVDPVDYEPVQHARIPNQDSKFSHSANNITNSLEENPSPLSQLSPLTFSPPLSCPNDLVVSEDASGTIASKIHSRRFREYCNQVLDKEIDNRCVQLLQDLVKFQDQMYHSDPSKAKLKKRFVLGLREVAKHLKVKKLKCVIISPNLEQTQSKGGLDETLKSIIEMCQAQEVPFIFALGRRALGRACAKLVPVSVVGIFSYEGVEENFAALKNLTEKAREAYSQMVNSFKREINLNPVDAKEVVESQSNTHDEDCETASATSANATQTSHYPCSVPTTTTTATTVTSMIAQQPGNFEKLFPHLGHSRTPSACSAISFVSSILSEPISENLPQSETENDAKVHDVEKSESDRDNHHCSSTNIVTDSIESDNINAEIKSNHHHFGEIDDQCKKGGSAISCGEGFINSENYLSVNKTVDEILERISLAAPGKTVLSSINELQDESEVAFADVSYSTNRSCEVMLNQRKENILHEDFCGALPYYFGDDKLHGAKRRNDKARKSSVAEDPDDDGNEADTEDDKCCRNIGRSRDCIFPSHASNHSRPRRRSKDDRSDDDRTVILAKEIDETTASVAVDENAHNRQISRDKNSSFSPAIGEAEVVSKLGLSKSPRNVKNTESVSGLVCQKVGTKRDDQTSSFGQDFKSFEKHTGPEESSLLLAGNLSGSTSTTSRIETWVAESQKALSGYGQVNEDEDEEIRKCSTDNEDIDVESDNNGNDDD